MGIDGEVCGEIGFAIIKNVNVINLSGWIACVLILAGFGYGFHTVEFRVNPWVRAIISTLGHTIWSMVLFWIVLASISQYGGKY